MSDTNTKLYGGMPLDEFIAQNKKLTQQQVETLKRLQDEGKTN